MCKCRKVSTLIHYKYQWRYLDKDRPHGECYDCGLKYLNFVDMIIPDRLWELINPTYHKGCGLLCPTCIANRLNFIREWYDFGCIGLYYQHNYIITIRRIIKALIKLIW